jgi:solute carrier family 25 uncoupling protein 8/9
MPNIARNCIINVGETVVYDSAKDGLIASGHYVDGIPCHFTAAVIAGFCATLMASPVDVIKTRYTCLQSSILNTAIGGPGCSFFRKNTG